MIEQKIDSIYVNGHVPDQSDQQLGEMSPDWPTSKVTEELTSVQIHEVNRMLADRTSSLQ